MARTGIKFTGRPGDRDGDAVRFGINGRTFEHRVGEVIQAEPEVIDFLNDNGISYQEVAGGAGSKEGSADPAPENTKPHMRPRSVEDDGDGDNAGDVTSAGSASAPAEPGDTSIASAAKVSDARVAAERQTAPAAIAGGLVSPAALAGEGEGGTRVSSRFDHDGDGKDGGSRKGTLSTAAKGAAKKRAAKK